MSTALVSSRGIRRASSPVADRTTGRLAMNTAGAASTAGRAKPMTERRMPCPTSPKTPNTVRNTIRIISTGTRPTCNQARKRPTALVASPGPVASMVPEPAVTSRWPAKKSSTTSLTLKPVTRAISSTLVMPNMISNAIANGAFPGATIQFMPASALAGFQLRQAFGDAVVARKRFELPELRGIGIGAAGARKAGLALENPVKGRARTLGAIVHRLTGTAGPGAGARGRRLLFHRLAIVLERIEHLAPFRLQRDDISFQARAVLSQCGEPRLEHRQLCLDVDLASQRGLGEIFTALLHRKGSLLAQRLVTRALLRETLGREMALRLHGAEIGPHIGDRRVDLAHGLGHHAFGRSILHGVDKAVEAA